MKTWTWLKKHKALRQRGISLMEAAVAVLLLGGCVVTLFLGISTGAVGVQKDDQDVTAQGLARSQMELIKNSAYDASGSSYPAVTTPSGYAVDVSVASVPDTGNGIQKVTAAVTRNGETVLTLQDYKVNR